MIAPKNIYNIHIINTNQATKGIGHLLVYRPIRHQYLGLQHYNYRIIAEIVQPKIPPYEKKEMTDMCFQIHNMYTFNSLSMSVNI